MKIWAHMGVIGFCVVSGVFAGCPAENASRSSDSMLDAGLDVAEETGRDASLDVRQPEAEDASERLVDLVELADDSDPEPEGEVIVEVTPPEELVRYLVGAAADAVVAPRGPGFVLMGGGRDVDEAFVWWQEPVAGGDVVILRASGADGYNDYIYEDIGGVDSVETLMVTTRALAEDPYVAQQVARAEGIFIAGGDQSEYVRHWRDTRLTHALHGAHERGAIIGGTSAGLAVLGEYVFSALRGTITSSEALSNPYNPYMTLTSGFLSLPPMSALITDSHFQERDRLGRLVTMVARLRQDNTRDTVMGLGINERTALVIDAQGEATVLGEGAIFLVRGAEAPQRCESGVPLLYQAVPYARFDAGETFSWSDREGLMLTRRLAAADGAVEAEDGPLY